MNQVGLLVGKWCIWNFT